jgi:hypothetical protein
MIGLRVAKKNLAVKTQVEYPTNFTHPFRATKMGETYHRDDLREKNSHRANVVERSLGHDLEHIGMLAGPLRRRLDPQSIIIKRPG